MGVKVSRPIDAAIVEKLLKHKRNTPEMVVSDSNDGRCNVNVQVHPGIEVVRVFAMAKSDQRWEVQIDGKLARILDTIGEGE